MSTPIEHLEIPLGERHPPHNWEYADATAREAATGFTPDDVSGHARQLDNNTIWMLTDDDPVTWVQVGGPPGVGVGDFIGPASSVASEIVLFDGTTGKLGKRATGSGFVKATSGVYSTESNPTAGLPFEMVVACSGLDEALTAVAAQMTFPWPRNVTLSSVHAFLVTPQTSGSTFTVDVNEAGSTILSTKITIDNGETDSTTAAAAPVLSDTGLAAMAKITVDIDQIGDGTAEGLYLVFVGVYA